MHVAGGVSQKKLVFGFSRSERRILHVSEVRRGASCGCVCSACEMDLVAKKGNIRVHHFSHDVGQTCETACESALHLFAKRAFSENRSLAFPNVSMTRSSENGENAFLFYVGAVTETFEKVLLEDWRDGFRPDAVGVQDIGETLVEFAVTHFVGEAKDIIIKKVGLRTIEVDLRGVNTEASLVEIAEEILLRAPRKWLWHPQWPIMEAELKMMVAARNSQFRHALEQQQREEDNRRGEAERQAVEEEFRRQMEAATALAAAQRLKTEPKSLSSDPGLLATRGRVKAAYLSSLVGVPIDGDWSMAVERTDWQAAFVDAFLLLPRRKGQARNRFLESATVEWAERRGMLSKDLLEVGRENEAIIKQEFPDFVRPSHVFRAYLEFLQSEGVISRNSGEHAKPEVWWKVCEQFLAEDL